METPEGCGVKPVHIKKGRAALIFSHNWLAIQMDGKCIAGLFLSDADKSDLELALRESRDRDKETPVHRKVAG
jgi:hypothetical protein